jgi:hypothetical protein
VKDDIGSLAGFHHGGRITNVAADAFDAECFKLLNRAPDQSVDAVAAGDELLGDVASEETAGAGDEGMHY